MNAHAMTKEAMIVVIESVKPGDRLKMVFANKTFDGGLYHLLSKILDMQDFLFDFGKAKATLLVVANNGAWLGFHRDYIATALPNFDSEYFINLTVGHGMLESVGLQN